MWCHNKAWKRYPSHPREGEGRTFIIVYGPPVWQQIPKWTKQTNSCSTNDAERGKCKQKRWRSGYWDCQCWIWLDINSKNKGDISVQIRHWNWSSTDKYGTLQLSRLHLYGPGGQLSDLRGYGNLDLRAHSHCCWPVLTLLWHRAPGVVLNTCNESLLKAWMGLPYRFTFTESCNNLAVHGRISTKHYMFDKSPRPEYINMLYFPSPPS